MAEKGKRHLLEGKPVVDARHGLEITVTTKDIANARRNKDASSCPVAWAIKRIYKTPQARVHLTRSYMLEPDRDIWTRFETPAGVKAELIAWDRGGAFQPGDYHLDRPALYHRLGYQERRKPKSRHEVARVRKYHKIESVRRGSSRYPNAPAGSNP